MADKFDMLNRRNVLPPRPRDVVQAEQQRRDRAQMRGIVAFFAALAVGGGLALFIEKGRLLRGMPVLQGVLVFVAIALPLAGSLVMLSRVPPAPFEALTDPDRDIDRRERERRAILLSQVLVFGLMALQWFWLWPRFSRYHNNWVFTVVDAVPTLCIVGLGIAVLYVRRSGSSSELRLLDDEVTQSFRARARSLGYLLLLTILAGLMILAQSNPPLAAHYLPLGVAIGVILPVLYFVYLDWQASRSG